MTKPHNHPPSPEPDDPAVQAEWRRLEEERLAEERAEAREDAEEAAHEPAGRRPRGTWPLIAFAIALAAGIVAALVVNRPPPATTTADGQAAAVSRTVGAWGEHAAGDAEDAGRRLVRVASTAVIPPERLWVRIGLRGERGRDRFETLLASSGLRIEGDLDAAAADGAAEEEAAAEKLAVSGRPAAVDKLLDALASSSALLTLEAEGLLAEPPAEEGPAQAAEPAAEEPPAEPEPAARQPERVRLRIEIIELPSEPPAAHSTEPAEAQP